MRAVDRPHRAGSLVGTRRTVPQYRYPVCQITLARLICETTHICTQHSFTLAPLLPSIARGRRTTYNTGQVPSVSQRGAAARYVVSGWTEVVTATVVRSAVAPNHQGAELAQM